MPLVPLLAKLSFHPGVPNALFWVKPSCSLGMISQFLDGFLDEDDIVLYDINMPPAAEGVFSF